MRTLRGDRVVLRPATSEDVDALVEIRRTPEVHARWRGDDLRAEVEEAIASPELTLLAIEAEGRVVGAIQFEAEEDEDYAHATLDLFVAPRVHRRGFGSDAIRTLVHFLFEEAGHHRLTIDPAADNHAAIRCYAGVGFREVGTLRQYERGPDGTWHDGLLMELLRDDLRARRA